jgi:hypothetical protein
VQFDKAEANVTADDVLFHFPAARAGAASAR